MAPFDGTGDGLGMAPRVKEPESTMLPGMAAPDPALEAPKLAVEALSFSPAVLVPPAIADTSGPGPTALQAPAAWSYDFDPTTGLSRATFNGEVFTPGGQLSPGGVTSFNTRQGAVTLLASDVSSLGFAPLASPALTGTPTVPTAAPGTNTTQAASAAFVAAAVAAAATPIGVMAFAAAGNFATTITKVPMAAPTVNLGGYWDATNNRWTPPAGTYFVSVAGYIFNTGGNVAVTVALYKNGAQLANSGTVAPSTGYSIGATIAMAVTFNGTDYVELWVSSSLVQAIPTTATYISAYGIV